MERSHHPKGQLEEVPVPLPMTSGVVHRMAATAAEHEVAAAAAGADGLALLVKAAIATDEPPFDPASSGPGKRVDGRRRQDTRVSHCSSLNHRQMTASVTAKAGSTTTGRWTTAEHDAFLDGMRLHGREWRKIVQLIPTRTSAQIRSHAQKHFAKASQEKKRALKSGFVPVRENGLTLEVQSVLNRPRELEKQVSTALAALQSRYKELQRQVHMKSIIASRLASAGNPGPSNPASAALEFEQKKLRQAAEARYELKRQQQGQGHTAPQTGAAASVKSKTSAAVSLASIPSMSSHGDFSSLDVLQLSNVSFLPGSVQNDRIDTIATGKPHEARGSLKRVREQLRLVEDTGQFLKRRRSSEET